MQTVATNVRFPKSDYEELKTLAFLRKKSTASLIREAVKSYSRAHLKSVSSRVSLAKKLRKLSVKIDIPVTELVMQGRKF